MQLDTLIPVSQKPLNRPKGSVGDTAVTHLTADVKDKPRNRPLVRMKVRNRCTAVLTLPHACSVEPGEWLISCYDDEVKDVLSLVEPRPDRIRDAQEQYQRAILSAAKKQIEGFLGTVDDLQAAIENGTAPDGTKEAVDAALRDSDLSVESVFHKIMERDVLPLDAAELIKDSEHSEPKRVEQVKEQDALANAMGKAMARELPAAMEALADAIVRKLQGVNLSNPKQGGQSR